jgi:hypothetical protein
VVTAVAYLCEQTALTGVIEAAEAQEPSIWVIPTDEEAVIASHTLAVVRSLTPGPMAAGELAASPTDTGSGGKYL